MNEVCYQESQLIGVLIGMILSCIVGIISGIVWQKKKGGRNET